MRNCRNHAIDAKGEAQGQFRCRFCGLGTYQRSNNKSGFSVPEAEISVTSGNYVVAMWCDHCGHIESFNLGASDYREWWTGDNKL
jgi:hypothetical protein